VARAAGLVPAAISPSSSLPIAARSYFGLDVPLGRVFRGANPDAIAIRGTADYERPLSAPTRGNLAGSLLYLVDIGPAPVALEDHLARLAAKHDLELPPPDRSRISAAHRTRCRLVHERTRKGVHFYL
jgi:hypothetical protein